MMCSAAPSGGATCSRQVLPALGLALMVLSVLAGCGPKTVLAQEAPTTPVDLLKWSMEKTAALSSFQAECRWVTTYGNNPGASAKRTLQYVKPNQFKLVTVNDAGNFTQTSISDGKKLVEFNNSKQLAAQSYTAPSSIADSVSMQMQHPMFCGTLFYQFLGGPEHYAKLVNEAKMPPAFGPVVTIEGTSCKTVTFWAQGMYGKTEVAIGAEDGLVHQIRYDSAPLMEQTRKMFQSPEFLKQIKKAGGTGGKVDLKALEKNMPTTSMTTETYTQIRIGETIEPSVFTAQVPEGTQAQEVGGSEAPQPPVPLGRPAPDIAVTGVDGSKKKLADFRGKVVLIDFWATWCPPCRKGLPETQKFYTQYGSKGLAVLTISDEDRPTVTQFLKKNKYIFPAYLDNKGATNKAYHIAAIPTVAIIDKKGNLSAYMVGLSPREEILAALKKAGLATK